MFHRLQRQFFILFRSRDEGEPSPPGTARGRGFNFTFTCGPIRELVDFLSIQERQQTSEPPSVSNHTHLEAVHTGLCLQSESGGGGEREGWGGGGCGCGGGVEEGVDGDGGHVVGVVVQRSVGRGAHRRRAGVCSLMRQTCDDVIMYTMTSLP